MKKEAFEFAWKRNWDWVGIAFRRDGKIFTYKTKEIDSCQKCLSKIFNSLGIEKEGTLIK